MSYVLITIIAILIFYINSIQHEINTLRAGLKSTRSLLNSNQNTDTSQRDRINAEAIRLKEDVESQ